ncbi:MAG: adenosylcobinamide-GDP ribazoletransferase, partial [Ilumatobacteraceae bacterium]
SAFIGAVAAHGLARSAAVFTMIVARPATGEGLGSEYVARLRRAPSAVGIAVTVSVAAVISGWWVAVALVSAVVTTTVLIVWSKRKIGGFSGDVLGAIEQCGEIGVFVVLSIVVGHHQPWW